MYADAETSLYYWNSRYYDPKTCRGIQPDRMSVAEHVERWLRMLRTPGHPPAELNPYVYVANNPLRWIDPTGEVIPWRDPYDDSEFNRVANPKGKCDICSDYASGMHNNVIIPIENTALGAAAGGGLAAAGGKAAMSVYGAYARTLAILRICIRLFKDPIPPALPPPVPLSPPPFIKPAPGVPTPKLPGTNPGPNP